MAERAMTVIGDGIEHPGNARALQAAAALFGGAAVFRDRAGALARERLPFIDTAAVAGYAPLLALENVPAASDVAHVRLPAGPAPALIAGNERRGIAHDLRSLAGHTVAIPLASRTLNTLNVAAATAVALYWLAGQAHVRATRSAARADVLLVGGRDHIELGSAIRSAGAFGWGQLLLDDRHGVWFGHDRAVRSEGRAAARRARNPILVLPLAADARLAYERVTVVTARGPGPTLDRADLGGHRLVALVDEEAIDATAEDWRRLGRTVAWASLGLAPTSARSPFRLTASIALAVLARRARASATTRPARRGLRYEDALTVLPAHGGETVYLDDLNEY